MGIEDDVELQRRKDAAWDRVSEIRYALAGLVCGLDSTQTSRSFDGGDMELWDRIMRPRLVCVTRHPTLVALLRERGIIRKNTPVLTHVADREDIIGRHVVGLLPLHLAALAARVTEVTINFSSPEERRAFQANEIPLKRLRKMAGPARTYEVREVMP